MWGIDYIFGMVTSFIILPLGAITAVSIFNDSTSIGSSLASLSTLFVSLLLAIPKALLFVYIGVAWTVAYLELTTEQPGEIE
jgi:hypothetical protein